MTSVNAEVAAQTAAMQTAARLKKRREFEELKARNAARGARKVRERGRNVNRKGMCGIRNWRIGDSIFEGIKDPKFYLRRFSRDRSRLNGLVRQIVCVFIRLYCLMCIALWGKVTVIITR